MLKKEFIRDGTRRIIGTANWVRDSGCLVVRLRAEGNHIEERNEFQQACFQFVVAHKKFCKSTCPWIDIPPTRSTG